MKSMPPAGPGDAGGSDADSAGGVAAVDGIADGRREAVSGGALGGVRVAEADPGAVDAVDLDALPAAGATPVGGVLERSGVAESRIDLAALGQGAVTSPLPAEDEPYEPGWLGVVLRWPVRVLAVLVIIPVQVVWQSAKAATRAVGRGLRRLGRGVVRAADRLIGRPLAAIARGVGAGIDAVGHAVGWLLRRLVWWPMRWFGHGTGRVTRWLYDRILRPTGRAVGLAVRAAVHGTGRVIRLVYAGVLRPIGQAVAFVVRAVGHGIARTLSAVARGLLFLARGLRDALAATVRAGYRWVLRPVGRGVAFTVRAIALGVAIVVRGIRDGLGAVGRAAYRWVLRPIGLGTAFLARGARDGLRGLGRAIYRWVLRPAGLGVALLGRGVRDGLRALGRAAHRWVLRPIAYAITALGRGIAWLAKSLFIPVRLAARGTWFVVRLLGHWLLGLLHVIGEGLAFAWRVAGAVGRGCVWVWSTVVWSPLCWIGRGLRTAWLSVWRTLRRGWLSVWHEVRRVWLSVWHGLRSAWLSVWRPVRDAVRRAATPLTNTARGIRRWYHHEVSEPIRSALRAAREDVRRALPGRRRG